MKSLIRVVVTFPLYIIFLIFFIKDPSFQWICNIILLGVTYWIIWWTCSHTMSITDIWFFYKQYIGHGRTHELFPIEKSKFSIDFAADFSYCVFNYLLQIGRKKAPHKFLSLIETPVLLFYPKPLGKETLASCKGYMYGPGMFAIVVRKNVNENSWEDFLFNHEMEHINDNGLINYRSNIRHQIRLIFHFIALIPFLASFGSAIAIIIFAAVSGFNLWLNPLAMRERIADVGSLLKIEKLADRLFAINILDCFHKNEFEKAKPAMRRVFMERQNYLNIFRSELSQELTVKRRAVLQFKNEQQFVVKDIETWIVTLLLFVASWFVPANPTVFGKLIVLSAVLQLLLYVISLFISTNLYLRVSNHFMNRFRKKDFYQPFDREHNGQAYSFKSLKEILEWKYRHLMSKDENTNPI